MLQPLILPNKTQKKWGSIIIIIKLYTKYNEKIKIKIKKIK